MEKESNTPSSRVSIIQAVQQPLGFFTLGLLILESALIFIGAQDFRERTGLLWASLILIFLTLVLVGALGYMRPQLFQANSQASSSEPVASSREPAVLSYKVFIASPMASFQDNEKYQADRIGVITVVAALNKFCLADRIYYPGLQIPGTPSFEDNLVATKVELEAIERSEIFMLIYPERVPSSVLFLAGYAMGLGKPAIIFSRRKTLPFLMQELDHLPKHFSHARIYEFDQHGDIAHILQSNGAEFLA